MFFFLLFLTIEERDRCTTFLTRFLLFAFLQILKPVFKLLHKKRRQDNKKSQAEVIVVEEEAPTTRTPSQLNPAAISSITTTSPKDTNWCDEIDDNAANEALEERLREDIRAAAGSHGYVQMRIEGHIALIPVHQGHHIPIPAVHFGTFWAVPDGDICCRSDVEVLTSSQTAQPQEASTTSKSIKSSQ